MKTSKSFRLPQITVSQIDRLTRSWEIPVSKSVVIQLAIAKLANERIGDDIVPEIAASTEI